MGSESFYRSLPAFSQFEAFTNESLYASLPDDWYVLLSDIQSSTQAIEEGRYREVNALGAASIACVEKELGAVAFVFGGDGATFLVHASQLEKAKAALLRLKAFSHLNFQMELRVGAIASKLVADSKHEIKVARYELAPGKFMATIRGGGLAWAEEQIKTKAEFQFSQREDSLEELEGLSCRWQPIPAKKGKVLTVLIRAQKSDSVFPEIIELFQKILDGGLENANPIKSPLKKYKDFFQCLKDEWLFNKNHLSARFFRRVYYIFLSVLVFKRKAPLPVEREAYLEQMITHSDYRKFDDMLRMILDCSPQEIRVLEGLLEKMQKEGKIYYGMHISDSALMTCLVEHLGIGGHIHFVDGSDGGYALAAKQLKKQMRG